MKKQRLMTLVLVAIMVAVFVTGCGVTGSTTTSPSASPAPSSAALTPEATPTPSPSSKNVYGWEIPKETLVINVIDANGNDAPSEGLKAGRKSNADFFLKNFNVKLDLVFSAGDGTEFLNLALASGAYPEIVSNISSDMMAQFQTQNRLVEVTPYMDSICKGIRDQIGKDYPLYINKDNKLWGIPSDIGILGIPDFSAYIRYDEWTAIGSPEIKTPQDYKKALYDILAKYPKTPAGESRYAMSFFNQGNPARIGGLWGLKQGFLHDETNNTFTYFCFTQQGKEMTQWLNSFYTDGKMDPDTFINTFDDWKAKFSRERILGGIGAWWTVYNAGHETWQNTDPKWTENKRFIQILFKADDAAKVTMTPKTSLSTFYTVLTDKAKNVEGILKFINWESTELGRAIVNWGLPNNEVVDSKNKPFQFWTIDDKGNWAIDPLQKAELIAEKYNYVSSEYSFGAPLLFYNKNNWPDGEHNNSTNMMWLSENKWKSILINNCASGIYDATAMSFVQKNENVATLEQAIKDAWVKNWPICVMAKNSAAFDSAWKTLQDACKTAGIEEYQQIYAANYINNLKIMGK